MEDWQKEWWEKLEKTAAEMEEFLVDVGEAAESFVDEVGETVVSFVGQLQETVGIEVDSFFQDFFEAISEDRDDFESYIWDDLDDFVDFNDDEFMGIGSQQPTAENNPACINCANYHGKIYNGNLLVCAMHPYGWEDRNCPDWSENNK